MSADTFFYKYTDANGAKKILGDLRILYTAPGKFNDPFDCKIGLRVDYDHEKFGPLLVGKLFKLLWSNSRPELLEGRPKREELLRLWETGDNGEKIQFIKEVWESWERNRDLGKFDEGNETINLMMSKLRVFCVSEIHDDLLMWAHYADKHAGTVIKLTMPRNPPGYWGFQKVVYSDGFPIHNTTEQLVDSMLCLWRPNPEETASKLLFTKSKHWEYEQEWRDIAILDEPDNFDEGKHCFDIEKERLIGVYFGVNMEEDDRQEIREIICDKLPHVEVYKAEKDKDRFKLNFLGEDQRR